ncbi:MAG: response regulator transcription factor [Saprospirales bacterium]|nr:response regulator transcription factor [Saprospirales bacterium]MBK8923937.1 response regulator transcription factor [Saprospirales bacterium]
MPNTTIRLFIVEDHTLNYEGILALLQGCDDIAVAGHARTGEQALELLAEYTPEVVLMDLKLPGIDGLETTSRLLALHPGAQVLVLSVDDDLHMVRDAIRRGARGYLTKNVDREELVNAIRKVAAGKRHLADELIEQILEQPQVAAFGATASSSSSNTHPFTRRELDVLRLMAEGKANKQIAEILFVSLHTVETHIKNMYSKCDASNKVELIRYGQKIGALE